MNIEKYDKELNLIEEYEYHVDDYFAAYHFLIYNNVFYNVGFDLDTRVSGKDKYSIAIQTYNYEKNKTKINYISVDTLTAPITIKYAKTNVITENGNLIFGAHTGDYLQDDNEYDHSSYDNYIVKVNPQCDFIWKYEFGKDNTFDLINHIEKLDDQNYLIVTKEGNHVKLYWMRDLDVGVNEKEDVSVKVYPNPASSYLRLQIRENITNAKIIDINGNMIMEIKGSNIQKLRTSGEVKLNIESLNSGTYFLVVDNELIRKFIVKK